MNVWRDRLSRWFTPLARRCPFSPNSITIAALVLNLVAAGLFYTRWFLPALAFVILGGLLDAFDGIVARVQGKATRYGDFLDHFADRVSDLFLVAGWLIGSAVRVEITIVALIVSMLNAYIGTQIEASWGERNYETIGRGEFVLALVVFPIVSHILFDNGWQSIAMASLTILEWMAIVMFVFAIIGIVQRFALAARLERR